MDAQNTTQLDLIREMSPEKLAPMLIGSCIRFDARYGETLAYTSPADKYYIAYPSQDVAIRKTIEWLNSNIADSGG